MKKLPNIYTILERIDFEKEAEKMESEILSLQCSGIDNTKFNREQILFSIVQKIYSAID
jgi:hypothetical protein